MVRYYSPAFDNPYPNSAWREISSYRYLSDLVLLRFGDPTKLEPLPRAAHYTVAKPYSVSFKLDGAEQTITVPAGLITDLVSVPSWARSVVGRVGPHLEACIVHDFLYVAWQDLTEFGTGGDLADNEQSRRMQLFSDDLLRAGLADLNMPGWRKAAIYRAVRIAGKSRFLGREQRRFVHPDSLPLGSENPGPAVA